MLEMLIAPVLWTTAAAALGVIASSLGEGLAHARRILSETEQSVRRDAAPASACAKRVLPHRSRCAVS